MIFANVKACRKRIQPLDAMRQTVLHQKIQCAVGNGWLVTKAVFFQAGQNIIGSEGTMVFQQDFQDPPSHWRQAQTLRFCRGFRLGQGGCCAMRVVVISEGGVAHASDIV